MDADEAEEWLGVPRRDEMGALCGRVCVAAARGGAVFGRG